MRETDVVADANAAAEAEAEAIVVIEEAIEVEGAADSFQIFTLKKTLKK